MHRQNESSSLDRSLQKLEFEMNWNMERSFQVRNRISKDIKREKRRTRIQKGFIYSSSFALVAVFFILLVGQLNEQINILNLSASSTDELDTINHMKISDLQTRLDESQVVQFTTPSGREMTIHTQENEWGSIDNAIAAFMSHSTRPALSYTTQEIAIANERAVLQEPVSEAKTGSYKLYVITERYVYYVQNSVAQDDKGDKEEILELAGKFKYD